MINLFRKVRKKLLFKGNSWRYFKYAIGEIFLVVVGILIALQINIWNERRKEAEKEEYYLERLKVDFLANENEADRIIAFSKFQAANSQLLIKSLYEPLNQEESIRWFFALNHVWFLPHPTYTTSTWDELKATGNLNILGNKTLIIKITDFYSLLDSVKKYEDEWGTFNIDYRKSVNNILNDSLRQFFLQNIEETGKMVYPQEAPDAKPYIIKLKSIEGIEGLISDISINRTVGKDWNHERLKSQIQDILSTLEEELNH